MTRIIFFILLFMFGSLGYAQKISKSIELSNGAIVDAGHVFVEGEDCTLHTDNGISVEWRLYLKSQDSDFPTGPISRNYVYRLVKCVNVPSSSFEIKIDDNSWNWNHAYKEYQQNDEYSTFCEAIVEIYSNGVMLERLPLHYNILPPKPQISVTDFSYEWDWEWSDLKQSGVITISAQVQDKLTITLDCAYCWAYEFDSDAYFRHVFEQRIPDPEDSGKWTIRDIHAEWGSYYRVSVANKYGWAHSDTIFTTDYIKEPEILAAIENLRPVTNTVTERHADTRITVQGNQLTIDGHLDEWYEILLYDMTGRFVAKANTPNVDLTTLPKGYYIVKFVTSRKLLTSKIFRP